MADTLLRGRRADRHATAPIEVLHGVDFTVDRGEVVVILGANGAGKTTTLRAICQMVATGGSIMLDGKDLTGRRRATSCATAWPTCRRAAAP